MSVIKASPVLSEGAEVATTPVKNETITAITDWRDTTVTYKKAEDGLDLRPRIHDMSATMLGLASSLPLRNHLQGVQRLHPWKSTFG